MTTWDSDTGQQDIEVLKRIHRKFGGKIALNAWTARPGPIRVGEGVTVSDVFDQADVPRYGRSRIG